MKPPPMPDTPPPFSMKNQTEIPEVRPHPTGGYTHAWPLTGSARIYTGHFPTAPAAIRAAHCAVNPRIRAALVAARARP